MVEQVAHSFTCGTIEQRRSMRLRSVHRRFRNYHVDLASNDGGDPQLHARVMRSFNFTMVCLALTESRSSSGRTQKAVVVSVNMAWSAESGTSSSKASAEKTLTVESPNNP